MQNRKVIGLLVVSVILASFLTYALASSPSTTFTITSGIYPGATSYTLYDVSGTYYAKDQNGLINSYGTDGAVVLQYAVDNLDTSGVILLNLELLDLGSTGITIDSDRYDGITIKGNGVNSTKVSYSGSGVAFTLGGTANQHRQFCITDMEIDGTLTMTGTAIYDYYSSFDILENLKINDFEYGIILDGCYDASLRPTAWSQWTTLRNIFQYRTKINFEFKNRPTAINMECCMGSDDTIVSGSNFIHAYGDQVNVFGRYLYSENKDVGYNLNTTDCKFEHVWCHHSHNTAFYLDIATRDISISNVIGSGATTWVTNNGARNHITGIYDTSTAKRSDYTKKTTMSSGTDTLELAHGLIDTPTIALVTGEGSDMAELYVYTRNSTYIVIKNAAGAVGSDRNLWVDMSCFNVGALD